MLSKSPVLKKEVEGLWREGSEKRIRWPHWSVEAAERFLEWIYGGDYRCPLPVLPSGDSRVNTSPPDLSKTHKAQPNPGNGSARFPALEASSPTQAPPKPAKIPYNATSPLEDLTWDGCRPLTKITHAEEYQTWSVKSLYMFSRYDYSATLMTHAELYVMACFYLLDDLKNMAWQRLRSVLISFGKPPGVFGCVAKDLATLIHYVYRDTADNFGEEQEEPMRMLVSHYASLHFTSLSHADFRALLGSGEETDRQFQYDVMDKVGVRLARLESVSRR